MNDYLDYLQDLEKGKTDVSPEDLAPPLQSQVDGLPYVEDKDPEIQRMEEKEAAIWANKKQLLQESIADDEAAYIASTENPTYEGFMNSEWGNAKVTPDRWKKDSTWILKRTKAGSGEMVAGTGQKGTAYANESTTIKQKERAPGPYDEERDEHSDDELPDMMASIAQKYGKASLKGSADELFQDMQNIVKNIILRRSDKRHALIWGDPGVGKTYEVMEICNRHMKDSPVKAKYVYEAGDIGSSMSSLVPFFYKHSKNKIIVLDDNDKMIMANLSQDIMNIIKALLDPKAADSKPISVRANMLKIFQARLDDLEELNESKGHWIEIDKEALREGECVIAVDDKIVVNSRIPLKEAQKLSNMIIDTPTPSPKSAARLFESDLTADDLRLYEAEGKSNKEFLADLIDADEDEYEGMSKEDVEAIKSMKASGASEQGKEGESFPRRFLFDSSVIFISNLEQDQINVAVLDRVESIGIKLSLEQFLQRLGRIYGGLCKGSSYSEVPQDLRDWAKKCVFTVLNGVVSAWRKRIVLFNTPIEINRKMTFRMFEEFTVAWIRYAYDQAENISGKSLDDKNYRDKLAQDLVPILLQRKVIPFLRQKIRS